jgi:hypothetical protein
MTRTDLTQLSQDALIDLVLEKQVEIDALRMKLNKGKKSPANSGNSSQPPSEDQKGNLAPKRKKHKNGPPQGHAKFERKFVSQPDHVVEIKPTVCQEGPKRAGSGYSGAGGYEPDHRITANQGRSDRSTAIFG